MTESEYLDILKIRDMKKGKIINPVYIISGGSGTSGKQIVDTVLAQFPNVQIPIIKKAHIKDKKQIEDRHRIIGLHIEYEQLLIHRKKRQEKMGTGTPSVYSDRSSILEELEVARKIYRKGKFHVVSVTNKPIESTADEIIEYINSYFKDKTRKI